MNKFYFKKEYLFMVLFLSLLLTIPHFWQLFFNKEYLVDYKITSSENLFNNLNLKAKAVFVWDINQKKVLYSQNENSQLPLASLAKIMMADTALGILNKNETVSIKRKDIEQEGDSGLLVEEKWPLKKLLELTLVSSSNDGASAIASVASFNKKSFIKKMNNKSKELNLQQTYFLNESGLDLNKEISGAYGSARDIALAFEDAIKKYPNIFEATKYNKIEINSYNLNHQIKNTNKKVGSFPLVIASKTGFTDLAGGNLVMAFDIGLNHPVIISILSSTFDGRFSDMEKLVWATIKDVNRKF